MEHSTLKRGLAPKVAASMLVFGVLLIALSAAPSSLAAGHTTITKHYDGSVTLVLLRPEGDCGDLNGSGQIDVNDAVYQLQVIVGLVSADPVQRFLGDIDRDGVVSVLDAIAIIQQIVGRTGVIEDCGPEGAVRRE